MRPRFLTLCLLLLTAACAPAQATTVVPSPTVSVTPAPTATASATPFPTAIPFTPTPTSTATPLPPPTATPSATPIPETVILFTGDINPARCVYYYAQQANDMALPYREMGALLQSADLAVGSLDASISDINPPTPCIETTRNLLAPSSVVTGLVWAGFDLITVATNHIKDCGLIRGCTNESMLDSLAHLRAAGIVPVGAGRNLTEAVQPAIFTLNGIRFAFLGFTAVNAPTWATLTEPGTMPSSKAVVVAAIQQAQQQADVVIVLPQWGREFKNEISLDQWTSAGAMVDAGAVLVVGNNPHRVQAVENFPNGAVVAYALGNFVFDQQWTDGTLYTVQGMVLKATFRGTALVKVELIPIHIHDNFQPRLAPPEEAAQILQEVELSGRSVPQR